MILTKDDLFDYIHCPIKYHVKHKLKVKFQDSDIFNKSLKKVCNFFLLNLHEGKVPTLAQIKKKWDKACEDNVSFMTPDKVIKGWGYLINFVTWAEEEQIIVADVNVPYSICVDGNMLQGYIDAILVTKEKHVELLDLVFTDRSPDKVDIDMKMKYSLDMEGFKQIYGKYPNVQKVFYAKHKKAITTTRGKQDYDRIRSTVKNVCNAINNGIYYPRENVLCKGCNCIEFCRYWHD